MKIAIFYASKHGTTQKVAGVLKNKFNSSEVDLFNLKEDNSFDLNSYELIVIGGSIHAGKIQSEITKFVKRFMQPLLSTKIGLFICCMNLTETETQLENSYPEILRNHASSVRGLGGEFIFENMNFFEKLIVSARKKTPNKLNINKIVLITLLNL